MTKVRSAFILSCFFMARASGAVLNFEGLSDLQPVDAFYSGVAFTNATAYVSGFSLNDAELPPASGVTVALGETSPVLIEWAAPVNEFSGLFTYSALLNLNFYLAGAPVGTVSGAYTNNLAASGEPGSTPNELISFQLVGGFDSVELVSAGPFGFDDLTYNADTTVVPETSSGILLIAGLCGILAAKTQRRTTSTN